MTTGSSPSQNERRPDRAAFVIAACLAIFAVVILWQTDHGYARTHTMDNVPMMTAGLAGGRLKGGIHVSAVGDPATRMGLTAQQLMGVPLKNWGTQSNQTSKTFTEILA